MTKRSLRNEPHSIHLQSQINLKRATCCSAGSRSLPSAGRLEPARSDMAGGTYSPTAAMILATRALTLIPSARFMSPNVRYTGTPCRKSQLRCTTCRPKLQLRRSLGHNSFLDIVVQDVSKSSQEGSNYKLASRGVQEGWGRGREEYWNSYICEAFLGAEETRNSHLCEAGVKCRTPRGAAGAVL